MTASTDRVRRLPCSRQPLAVAGDRAEDVVAREGHGMTTTVLRTCNLCEAGCGLELDVDDNRVVAVRPDENDPLSRGFVCPKGIAIADIHHDPDRLHRPMRRDGDGRF